MPHQLTLYFMVMMGFHGTRCYTSLANTNHLMCLRFGTNAYVDSLVFEHTAIISYNNSKKTHGLWEGSIPS